MTTIEKITAVCDGIKTLLIEKNRKYGDAATHPLHIFSKDDAAGAIRARIDDKLSRIANAQADDDEDAVTDLIGYLILLKTTQMDDETRPEGGKRP